MFVKACSVCPSGLWLQPDLAVTGCGCLAIWVVTDTGSAWLCLGSARRLSRLGRA